MARKYPDKPTEVQQQLMAFIQQFDAENGYPPTVRDMQTGVGISSPSMVNHNLQHLVRLGYIERDAHTSRGVRVVKSLSDQVREAASAVQRTIQDVLSIPVVGRIFASQGHLDKTVYLFKTVATCDLVFVGGQNGAHQTLDLGGFHFHQTLHFRVHL